jgi:hypothetical protein
MKQQANGVLESYRLGNSHFDEVFKDTKEPKEHYQSIVERFNQLSLSDFERINNEVKTAFFNQGITFAVYSDDKKPDERIFPFDLFPRIIPNEEWINLENGVIQRNKAFFGGYLSPEVDPERPGCARRPGFFIKKLPERNGRFYSGRKNLHPYFRNRPDQTHRRPVLHPGR